MLKYVEKAVAKRPRTTVVQQTILSHQEMRLADDDTEDDDLKGKVIKINGIEPLFPSTPRDTFPFNFVLPMLVVHNSNNI